MVRAIHEVAVTDRVERRLGAVDETPTVPFRPTLTRARDRARPLAMIAAAMSLTFGLAACGASADETQPASLVATSASTDAVPDLVGRTLDEARAALTAAGIPITSETDIRDGKMVLSAKNWTVVEQSGDATGVVLGVEKPVEAPAPTVAPAVEPAPAAPAPAATPPPAAAKPAPAAPAPAAKPAPAAPAPAAEPAPPAPAAEPAPAAPAPAGDYYKNCTEAREAGVAPLHRGDPGYRSAMDRDGDGVACE